MSVNVHVNVDVNAVATWMQVKKEEKPVFNLDPISLLFMLALLPFMEENSKYEFSAAGVVIQQPSEYATIPLLNKKTMSIYRTAHNLWYGGGASKEDLNHFKVAFKTAARMWDPARNEEVRRLFQFSLKGFVILMKTYGSKDMTTDAIDFWTLMINKACTVPVPESRLSAADERIKNIWNESKIAGCNAQIILAEKNRTAGTSFEHEVQYVKNVCADQFKSSGLMVPASNLGPDNSNND